jgi:uncharacterized surface protein with fasciclin (FAS1) repeats
LKTSAFLSLLIVVFAAFISCKNDSESTPSVSNEKVSVAEAIKIIKTPIMLGKSVYEQVASKERLRVFKEALPPSLKNLLAGTAGPYTVFVPTNDAFFYAELSTLDKTFFEKYIVKGELTTAYLVKRIREHEGSYTFITIAGTELKASRDGMEIVIEDPFGNKAPLQLTDYLAENGVVHVIENILE